jgi:hypothetical protein
VPVRAGSAQAVQADSHETWAGRLPSCPAANSACQELLGVVSVLLSCGFGVRSDSRAIAIVTAPASTASPASCPPMRRGSSGTVAAASAVWTRVRALADGCCDAPVVGVGLAETVGNKSDGSVGDTAVPGIAGRSVPVGRFEEELGIDVLAATTTSEAVPLKDRAPEAVASAEMRTWTPTPAAARTRTLASSSAAWPTGKVPTAHVAWSGWGHTVKAGAPA